MGEAASLAKQLEAARRACEEKDRKIEALLQQAMVHKEEAAEREAAFVDEAATKAKLADLYRAAAEEAQARIASLEAQADEQAQAGGSVDERIAGLEAEHEAAERQLRQALAEKEALVESLRAAVPGAAAGLSATAAAALQTVKSGQSFSQVFADLAQARTGLLEATQENERLKRCLRDICEDIESRLPGIQADREENLQLKATVGSLSERLLAVSQAREAAEQQLAQAEGGRAEAAAQAAGLQQQTRDLGLQVQTLLLQGEGLARGTPDGALVDSDQVITNRLVAVKSVAELQVRNQELLRVVRDLSSRAEQAERSAAGVDPALQQRLKAALREVEELREARARQAAMVESLVAGGGDVVDLTADERAPPPHDPQTLQLLEAARGEAAAARTLLAKAQARAEFGQERLDLLRSNYEACRGELEGARQAALEQSRALVRVQGELQGMLSEVVGAKEAARRAEGELAGLRTTLSGAQATERRLAGEKEALAEEKQRLAQLLNGLQAMVAESEAASQSIRERLAGQLETLERELYCAPAAACA